MPMASGKVLYGIGVALTTTEIVIVVAVVLLLIYDVFAVMKWGVEETISSRIWTLSHKFPVIPFATGFLCGHFFFSQC